MYKTILVPLDASKRAETIFPHVEALAQKFGSQLVLLQVVEPMLSTVEVGGMVPYYDPEIMTRWLAEAKTYLEGVQGELHKRGIGAKVVVESGSTVFSILAVAKRENADLIALASHGRTGLARVFYGSVAAGILNQTDRPLLLTRAQV
ncbi:MAG: universal stress protein [Chloroflexi bacterium]|nr:universal stress protein [Chloroflexota bacterium]